MVLVRDREYHIFSVDRVGLGGEMAAPALSTGLDDRPASKHGAWVSNPSQFENSGKDIHDGCKSIGYSVGLRHQGRVADNT